MGALVLRVDLNELTNVDDIIVQFSGLEQELIGTPRAMEDTSIAQGARAAVKCTAKREAGKSGRPPTDDESSEGISASERSVATLSPSERSSEHSPRYRRDGESITCSTSKWSEGATTTSYSTGASDSRSGTTGSDHSGHQAVAIGKVGHDTTSNDACYASFMSYLQTNLDEKMGSQLKKRRFGNIVVEFYRAFNSPSPSAAAADTSNLSLNNVSGLTGNATDESDNFFFNRLQNNET